RMPRLHVSSAARLSGLVAASIRRRHSSGGKGASSVRLGISWLHVCRLTPISVQDTGARSLIRYSARFRNITPNPSHIRNAASLNARPGLHSVQPGITELACDRLRHNVNTPERPGKDPKALPTNWLTLLTGWHGSITAYQTPLRCSPSSPANWSPS